MHLPYRETAAENLAISGLKHPNLWVRRAAAVLAVRGRISWANNTINKVLVYHADPEVARIGLFWQHQMTNSAVANREITNLLQTDRLDITFQRRLPTVYLMRCIADEQIRNRLRTYVDRFSKSRSAVVRWHCEKLKGELSS